jgi:putative restriction endonuclease
MWSKGDQRAPHKPLLILLALGKFQQNQQTVMFAEIKDQLAKLIEDFGPPRKAIKPQFPFVRLANDGIWRLNKNYQGISDPSANRLVEDRVVGSFTPEVLSCIQQNKDAIPRIAQEILTANFPETLHEDILTAVGLDVQFTTVRIRRRDPLFRDKVLEAYRYRCAICGTGIRMKNAIVALEAAHIKWHQAHGPDTVENGMALCSMHHKLLDVGAFTVDHDFRVQVSPKANGVGIESILLHYNDKPILEPEHTKQYPNPTFLDWHVNEVYKGGY